MPTNNNSANISPERVPRTPPDASEDSDDPAAPLIPTLEVGHIPVFHTLDALPAPLGNVPQALHRAGYEALRNQAKSIFDFLASPNHSLLRLNESSTPFVALVNIPKSNKVKVIFCPGFGSSPIGTPSVPTDGKLLCLHGKGSPEWGPPQPLVFLVLVIDCHAVTTMEAEEFSTTVAEKGPNFLYPLLPEARLMDDVQHHEDGTDPCLFRLRWNPRGSACSTCV